MCCDDLTAANRISRSRCHICHPSSSHATKVIDVRSPLPGCNAGGEAECPHPIKDATPAATRRISTLPIMLHSSIVADGM
jgi:hypothetical protein